MNVAANKVFADRVAPCCSGLLDSRCLCGPRQRVLMAFARGAASPPMTDAERRWCVEDADFFGEGSRPPSAAPTDDAGLAEWVLDAWRDYVAGQL